jgi:hypothetical protein
MGDTSQQFVADAHGAILNTDEQAWLAYKSQRDNALLVKTLQKQVAWLMTRVQQLEEKIK